MPTTPKDTNPFTQPQAQTTPNTDNTDEKLAEGATEGLDEKATNSSPARSPVESEKKNDVSSPSGEPSNDVLPSGNLSAAVDGLGVDVSVGSSTGASSGVPAQKAVYVRVAGWKHDEWVAVAEGEGVSLSEFVRLCVDPVVEGKLRCSHPVGSRRVYPWSVTCLLCGVRLEG